MQQTVLNFKLEYSEKEKITPYAGLGVYAELYKGIGIDKLISKIFPEPGSPRGFKANKYIYPLVLMFIGGGKYIEDIRKIDADESLKNICVIDKVPTSDAYGDWLRRYGQKRELLHEVDKEVMRRVLKKAREKKFTLDIDAFGIESNKEEAKWTYAGYKGYMPIAGFIPELEICVGYEFREGSEAPASRNYEFIRDIMEDIKETGKKIMRVRSDSAAYQAGVFNYINRQGAKYTITVSKDVSVIDSIKQLKDTGWTRLKDSEGKDTDREYGEFIHTMNGTDHSFRIIVQRWLNPQRDLIEETEEYCYHGIATNCLEEDMDTVEVIRWHNKRSNSENYNKQVKSGFKMEYMPCGDFNANAVWFGVGILAYNLFIMSKLYLFPNSWKKKKIETIRWQFIQMAGKVISHSRELKLRICSTLREIYEMYKQARQRCWELQYQFI